VKAREPRLLVSHDRDFLDRVVTSTIATDGNGRWVGEPGPLAAGLQFPDPLGSEQATGRSCGVG
jgi:ATPase subunit of ABC transporter with duplicated ATPase domains